MPIYAGVTLLLAVVLVFSVSFIVRFNQNLVPEHGGYKPDGKPQGVVVHPKSGAKKPILCFVIDDVGQSMEQLRPFLEFPGPVTLAVIPFLPKSREAMDAIAAKGKLVILHEPMQALGNQDPGPGALFVGDRNDQVQEKLILALDSLPLVKGVNNHMGSAFTEDPEKMKIVLQIVKERHLFFFDSKTTSRSAAKKVGLSLGLVIQERDVFLDNEKSREYILQAIEEGKKTAREKGRAVMIGHVWSSDLAQVMMEIYPTLLEEGFTLEDLSRFMQGEFPDDGSGD